MKILTAFLIAVAATVAVPASAQEARAQLERKVATDLPDYVSGIETSDLTAAQLGRIYRIMYSTRGKGEKVALIKSTLGGEYSLRGAFGW